MALIRTLLRGRSRLHFFGVESYAGAMGGDNLFTLLEEQRPSIVFMESFAAPDADVCTGGPVPYADHLHPAGLQRALAAVADPSFRTGWSCEAVGVLAALRIGAEIRFIDRMHTISFDRLIARRSLDEMRMGVINATEGIAKTLERRQDSPFESGESSRAMPQNTLCPFFPELWDERHAIMAHNAHEATSGVEERNVAVVLGAEHVDPVKERLETDVAGVEDLLAAPDDESTWEVELEKRSAIAALLSITRSFPIDHVLPAPEELVPNAREIVQRHYPKYRTAIGGRLPALVAPGTQASMMAEMSKRVHGLEQLNMLCNQLAPTEQPPTPPPPPQASRPSS